MNFRILIISIISLSYLACQTHKARLEISEGHFAVERALDLVGSSYKYAGNSPKGFDCSGLVKFIFNESGASLSGGSRHIIRQVDKVSKNDVQAGDLAFFTLNGKVDHVGIVERYNSSSLWLIHSTSSRGVIHEDVMQNSYFKTKLHAFGRVQL